MVMLVQPIVTSIVVVAVTSIVQVAVNFAVSVGTFCSSTVDQEYKFTRKL